MPVVSNKVNKPERGQSFIELSLVVIFLMIFVSGIVEFGFLLNDYLNLVDASREAVRYYSPADPFDYGSDPKPWPTDPNVEFYLRTIELTEQILMPLELDSSRGDDIVVTFFKYCNTVYERYPDDTGYARYLNQGSKLTNTEMQSRLDPLAPPTGVLLVEIFYHKPQVLRLPVFTEFIPDPIPVYVYAIMPLPAAEPDGALC